MKENDGTEDTLFKRRKSTWILSECKCLCRFTVFCVVFPVEYKSILTNAYIHASCHMQRKMEKTGRVSSVAITISLVSVTVKIYLCIRTKDGNPENISNFFFFFFSFWIVTLSIRCKWQQKHQFYIILWIFSFLNKI